MKSERTTPEELIAEMSTSELRELLCDLGAESTLQSADRLRQLVRALGSVERAMSLLAGPTQMRRAG